MTAPTPSPIVIETRLPDDQLEKLADLLAARLPQPPAQASAPVVPVYYTAEEAAALLKTTTQTISALVTSGKLTKTPIGRREYRISQAALDAYEAAYGVAK